MPLSRMSLFWNILLSTSVALTTMFAVTLVIVERHVMRSTYHAIEEAVNGSFQAYDSLWRARADKLAAVSLVLSRMPDVRGASSTRDEATIRDTAGEIWATVSDQQGLFLVADPEGQVIASLGGAAEPFLRGGLPAVPAAARFFPQQRSGFMYQNGRLYQVVVTPVYVDTARGAALLTVLLAGYVVDDSLAQRFKETTGGSDFAFLTGGRIVASTLPEGTPATPQDYAGISRPLVGVDGSTIGELRIYRSFAAARQTVAALLRDIYIIWIAAVLLGLALTSWLARRIVRPVREMDRAAGQIAKENYDVRVPEGDRDELGRLGRTFNAMCVALQSARANLIRQERFSTISKLSTSIIHDLRNPLASIYGGAEMLVDRELPAAQVKILATNIYNSSARIRDLLADLAGITRGRSQPAENCNLGEVIAAACDAARAPADESEVEITVDVAGEIELPLERARMERVFFNLISNAIEAMPDGGKIRITAKEADGTVLVEVEDNGRGIAPGIRASLFEPFVTAGKKDGLGLGLALARQAVLDHGGDMWVEPAAGARFVIRLPLKRSVAT